MPYSGPSVDTVKSMVSQIRTLNVIPPVAVVQEAGISGKLRKMLPCVSECCTYGHTCNHNPFVIEDWFMVVNMQKW